jgi:multidrug efflux pump subunit AcrB
MMDVIGDLTNNPSPIEIKLFCDDPQRLREAAARVKALIDSVPGVVDAFDGVVISGPSLVVDVDPLAAARVGLSTDDVRAELATVLRGSAETSIQSGEKLLNVRVRFPDAYRFAPEKLADVRLTDTGGVPIRLGSVATIRRTAGQAEVRREGLRQMIAVTARIEGRDLGRTVDDVKKLLAARFTPPKNTSMEFGGVYQTEQESFIGLLLVACAGAVLVFFVLLIEFREFAVPFSILIITILSLAGVFAALWITGETINISSIVGMIMIIGIVAENAIFILHTAKGMREEGMPPAEALIEAGIERSRPILMTMLAAVLALFPLALGIGAGAQMQRPLAIAVIGGFTLSTFLLLFVLPPMYCLIARVRMEEATPPDDAGSADTEPRA